MSSRIELNAEEIKSIFKDKKAGNEEFFKVFSVLVPMIEKKDGLCLLYEKRAKHMTRQPGEICFPGGELEDGETTLECALRETREEIGITEEKVDVVSQLDTIFTYSNFAMHCYLGIIKEESLGEMKFNEDEVEDVFTVDICTLMDNEPTVYWTDVIPKPPEDFPYSSVTGGEPYDWRKGTAPVPVYREIDGNVIWGLTARITKRFIDSVRNGI